MVLVAILAAGESKRMGRPKLCLPWLDTTILGHVIRQWRQAGAKHLLVVHAPGAETPVVKELNRLGLPAHERVATVAPERGMMGSVVTAARLTVKMPALAHLIIALGDQPQVRVETLQMLLAACVTRKNSVLRVSCQGRPGHPLALPAACLADLSATSIATLRDFLGLLPMPPEDLASPDSGILLDIDTPDEYDKASQLEKCLFNRSLL
ncbi:MAG TPA: NTP transferase domain-containing protein [Candidatus Methylacidiphilales bacterium]|nr:NTP transferase domain-containing protein [Candidatus Methylacidiphilales bacterium]